MTTIREFAASLNGDTGRLSPTAAPLLPRALPQAGLFTWSAAGEVHPFRRVECACLRVVATAIRQGATVFDVR